MVRRRYRFDDVEAETDAAYAAVTGNTAHHWFKERLDLRLLDGGTCVVNHKARVQRIDARPYGDRPIRCAVRHCIADQVAQQLSNAVGVRDNLPIAGLLMNDLAVGKCKRQLLDDRRYARVQVERLGHDRYPPSHPRLREVQQFLDQPLRTCC